MRPAPAKNFLLRVLLGVLILGATGEFLWRGPVRFVHHLDLNDFISPFIQTRAWLEGIDPYAPASVVQLWPPDAHRFSFLDRELADGSLVIKRGIPTAYPPTCFVLLAALTELPWRVAAVVWLAINLVLFLLMLRALLLAGDFRRDELRTYIFLGLALALAPFHTGFAAGSIVIPVVALGVLAVHAARQRKDILCGILVGIAVALKPQVGLPFLLYYVLRRRWRVSTIAGTVAAALAVVALVRFGLSRTAWWSSYLYVNRVLLAPGSLGDFTGQNPLRFGLVNLQVLTYTILGSRPAANVSGIVIGAIAALLWLLFRRRAEDHFEGEILQFSTLLTLSLLPVYHRFYDASLLIFPLFWAMMSVRKQFRAHAAATVILILPFLIPGATLLEELQTTNRLSGGLFHSWGWLVFVMPHQVWILLLLSVVLLGAMRANRLRGSDENPETDVRSSSPDCRLA